MDKNYKLLAKEQREKFRLEKTFGEPTEDITLILEEKERKKWGEAPRNLRPEHPRVMLTEDTVPGIRAALEDDTATNALFKKYLDEDFDGILPPAPEYDGSSKEKDFTSRSESNLSSPEAL